MARSSRTPTLSQAETYSLYKNNNVADTIINSVLYNMEFIASIAGNLRKMVDRMVDEYHLRDMQEAYTRVADDELSI